MFRIPKFAPRPPYQQVASLHGGDQCSVCRQGRHEGGYTFCPHFRAMHPKDRDVVAATMKRLTHEKNLVRRRARQNPKWTKGESNQGRQQKKKQHCRQESQQPTSTAALGLALAREQRQFAEAVGDAVGKMGNVPGMQQNQSKRKQKKRK